MKIGDKVVFNYEIGLIILIGEKKFMAKFNNGVFEFFNDGTQWAWQIEPVCYFLKSGEK